MSNSVLYLTTGQPGCGKTYSRVRWLISEFLPNSTGLYITNFPLNVELIADAVASKTGKTREEYISRIHVIPNDEMKSWMSLNDRSRKQDLSEMKNSGNFRPVQYLESLDLNNARVAIDEFHLYFEKKSPPDLLLMWNNWFSEIRKTGCTFEAITQDMSLLPVEFIGKVGVRTDLIPYGTTRDPFLNIPLSDYYELRAAYLGIREQKICQTEYRKGTSFTGRAKWLVNHVEKFSITSEFFPFYNSYQRTGSDGKKGSVTLPADRYKKLTALWFLRRHFFKLLGRLIIVVLFFWLTLGGGFTFLIDKFVRTLGKVTEANMRKKENANVQPKKPNPVSPSVASSAASGATSPVQPGEGVTAGSPGPVVPDLSVYKPSMFLDKGCYLRSGLYISVGYIFRSGHYEGKKIVSINFSDRSYELDNGELVSMY